MEKIGIACGRFQIFHREHLEYVLAAKERCEHLIVGITSADPSASPAEKADANRGRKEANPCTYYERMKMVEAVLLEAGLPRESFDIVPFPIGVPENIRYYVPEEACVFVTILDAWGHTRRRRLENAGCRVCVLWERSTKGVSSSEIRRRICTGEDWSDLVPPATHRFLTEHGIDRRIRETGAI